MKKKQILLIGGGGHCRSAIDVIEQENIYEIIGIVDKKERLGELVFGYKIIATDDELDALFSKYKYACVTIGQIQSSSVRVNLFEKLKKIGYTLPTIISPLAYVSKHATLGEGTIIMHQALINSNAKIGRNCIINTKSLIEHDATIEDNVHISTSAVVNGGTLVKEHSFVGSNAVLKEYIKVDGFVKAGSLQK